MYGLLGWLGGFWGPAGEEYVEEEGTALAANCGRGHFSEDAESAFQQLQRVIGSGVTFVRAYRDKLLWNANPRLAVDLIGEWETQLGLPSGEGRSLIVRQSRIGTICLRPRSATTDDVDATLAALAGGAFVTGVTAFSEIPFCLYYVEFTTLGAGGLTNTLRETKQVIYDHTAVPVDTLQFTPNVDNVEVEIIVGGPLSVVVVGGNRVVANVVPGITTFAALLAVWNLNPAAAALVTLAGTAGTFPVGYLGMPVYALVTSHDPRYVDCLAYLAAVTPAHAYVEPHILI